MPTIGIVQVSTARQILKSTERQHLLGNILSGVATGLRAASYESETAKAITIEGEINRSNKTQITQQQLLDELQDGLLQRHTVFPGKSYMGVAQFPVPIATINASSPSLASACRCWILAPGR